MKTLRSMNTSCWCLAIACTIVASVNSLVLLCVAKLLSTLILKQGLHDADLLVSQQLVPILLVLSFLGLGIAVALVFTFKSLRTNVYAFENSFQTIKTILAPQELDISSSQTSLMETLEKSAASLSVQLNE